jgi:uncharacterized membrane protein YedE/YeeE
MIRTAAAVVLAAALAGYALQVHADPELGRNSSFTVLCGAAFGFILQRSRFCFTAAFRDLFLLRDRRVMLGLLAALAAGSVGYAVVMGAWVPDPSAGYLPPQAHIAPAGWHLLLGGGAFGVGMVLAGGCVSGHLYRLGEGALTAPVALAGAVGGYWLGFLSWNFLYVQTIATAPVVWFPRHLGSAGALALQLGALGALAAWLLWKLPALPPRPDAAATLRSALRRAFVTGWPASLGGVAIGAVATFAFLRTNPLGVTSQIGLLARLSGQALGIVPSRLEGLDAMAGCRPIMGGTAFTDGGRFVAALVAGSLLAALLSGEFRLRPGRPRAHLLALGGGALLGFGAMISLGCTVGTLLSGVMAFSLSGWVFGAALLGGAWLGVRVLRRLA